MSGRKAAATAVMQRIDRREQREGEEDDGYEGGTYGPDGRPIRARKEELILNQYEQTIAAEVVAPEDIAVGFEGTTFEAKGQVDPITD